jgi:hypothetical protein
MKSTKLLLLIGAIVIALCQITKAQEAKWTLLKKTNNVIVSYQKGTCMGKEVLTLQMVNNNEKEMTVSWSLWNNGNFRTIQLKGNEKKTGECSSSSMLNEFIPEEKSISNLDPVIKVN